MLANIEMIPKPDKLERGMLKFIKSKSNTYDFVELRSQLLHIFKEESEMSERLKMKRFLKFLTDGEFIEVKSRRGIGIIVENGRPIPRSEISVIARLTHKGVEYLEKEKTKNLNKFAVISAFIFSLFSVLYSYFESNKTDLTQEILKEKINNISQELLRQKDSLKSQKNLIKSLNSQLKEVKSDTLKK